MAKTWKPSKAQQDMLDFVSHEMQYVRSGTREFRTMQSLEKRGLVKYYPRQEYSKNGGVRGMSVWGITEKGKPYVAELVAFMVDFEAKQNAQPATGTAQAATETPVSPVLNNALNVLTGENHQWVEVKPEQRIAEIFSLLDDAGVRDGNLMSITDRVKALIQEVEHLRAALTPFAAMGEFYKERAMEYARPESVWYALNHIKVTYADLFAAYEALAEAVGE